MSPEPIEPDRPQAGSPPPRQPWARSASDFADTRPLVQQVVITGLDIGFGQIMSLVFQVLMAHVIIFFLVLFVVAVLMTLSGEPGTTLFDLS